MTPEDAKEIGFKKSKIQIWFVYIIMIMMVIYQKKNF